MPLQARPCAHGCPSCPVQVGDVVQGVVQSVKPYGAFVDLGGVTGLLHVSQISHERITSVDKILQEGDKLKVRPHGSACSSPTG